VDYGYLINQTRGEIALRRGRTSATLVDLTLVLWTPGPIRSHQEEFLPEGLRAYGRPLSLRLAKETFRIGRFGRSCLG